MKNWEKQFDEEFQWLFNNRIMFDTFAGIEYLNVELTREDIKQFIQNLLDKQKEDIKEKANAYDEDGEPVKIFWS